MKRIFITLSLLATISVFTFAQVTMQKGEEGILILDDGEKVLFYQAEPLDYEKKFKRQHYIHPLWSPNGAVLTEDFPSDHLHHRGVFWAWHQVWIGDRKIGDPWELVDFEQKISEIEFRSRQDGTGILNIKVNWLSDKWKIAGSKVPYMEENTNIIIYQKVKNFRRIDFEISLLALENNLSIGGSEDEKGYSGFSVRMVLPPDVKFAGPDGDVKPEVTAVDSPGYINISGSIDQKGKKAGIVIIDHPDNPGYPQPWILRDKNSMQNAAFPGNGTVPVSTENPLVLKYTLLVYSGNLSNKRIQRVINDL